MGTSFGHLNIQGAELSVIETLCPDFEVRSILPGWITVASEELEWGTVQKEARRISKAVAHPVLATEYFDDDYAEFSLYVGGKRAARHIPAGYEDIRRLSGKSQIWAEQLGLSQDEEKILQSVFEETDAETSLRLLEIVLHCPLWMKAGWTDQIHSVNPAYLAEYLKRKAAEKKTKSQTKNQTKLVRRDKINGNFSSYSSYPVITYQSESELSIWDIRDGALRSLFGCSIQKGMHHACWLSRGENAILVSTLQIDKGDGTKPAVLDLENCARQVTVYSENGERIASDQENFRCQGGTFLDRDRVLIGGTCWNFRTNKLEWDLGLEGATHKRFAPCCLSNGKMATLCTVRKASGSAVKCLVSFRRDGTEKCVLELPPMECWPYPVGYQNDILLGYGRVLVCYNSELEEKWRVDLKENFPATAELLVDHQAGVLYIKVNQIIRAFDLEARKVKAVRSISCWDECTLEGVFPGIGPIVVIGNTALQIWDSELTIKSKHKTKETIIRAVHQNGHVYVLTKATEGRAERFADINSDGLWVVRGCVCLYELKA